MKKIGIDFHGVITAHPEFFKMFSECLIAFGCEIHLMTGSRYETFIKEVEDLGIDVVYTHFFSVSDHHIQTNPDKIDISLPDHPRIDDKTLWDKTKGEYAFLNKIDLVIDDTPAYASFFKTPFMLFQKGSLGFLSTICNSIKSQVGA